VKNAKLIASLVVLAVLVGFGIWAYYHVGFNFATFRLQLAQVNWTKIAIAVGCIYLAYVFRAVRWALLLRHNKKVGLFFLTGTQVIGFTSVALVGRVADLVRPYLVAKKTGLTISSQIAVYIVERLFDAASMALLFSLAILVAPAGTLPHPEIFKKVGYWGLAGTFAGAAFLVLVRLSGGMIAAFFERTIGVLSKAAGHAVGEKIRSFRTGLDTLRTMSDLALTLGVSLGMWALITTAYLLTATAFTASPHLAQMTVTKGMVLMIVSGGASIFQLPVLGWFIQIGVVATALSKFFDVPPEAATACAAMLLIATFLSVVPVGIIWAQFEKVSLRKVAKDSEQAGEAAADSAVESPSESPSEA
jgi:glycosyltransferase 2 family protein